MAKRYELAGAARDLAGDIFTKTQRDGGPQADDRLMLEGIILVLCSGAVLQDMPGRFGPWSTIYQRFQEWRDCEAFDQMCEIALYLTTRLRCIGTPICNGLDQFFEWTPQSLRTLRSAIFRSQLGIAQARPH